MSEPEALFAFAFWPDLFSSQDPVFLLYDNNMMWACLVPQGWVHRGESPPVSLAVIGDGG